MKGRTAPEYTSRVSFVMPEQLYDRVTEAATSRMQSLNSWLRAACLAALAQESKSNDLQQR